MSSREDRTSTFRSEQKSRPSREQEHRSNIEILKDDVRHRMSGFLALNSMHYQKSKKESWREKNTFQRPTNTVSEEEDFFIEPKESWPVTSNMKEELPIHKITKQPTFPIPEPNWTVPVFKKAVRQPVPVHPQSRGVKLRPVEDILNDGMTAGLNSTIPASNHTPTKSSSLIHNSSNNSSSMSENSSNNTKNRNSANINNNSSNTLKLPPRAKKEGKSSPAIPDKTKGSLGNIPDSKTISTPKNRSSPSSNSASRPTSATVTPTNAANRPRKSSLLKSEINTTDAQSPPNKNTNRPRVSSKNIMAKQPKDGSDIPDLIEARKYILNDEKDEVQFRQLKSLAKYNQQIPHKRPVLIAYFSITNDNLKNAIKNRQAAAKDTPTRTSSRAGKTTVKSADDIQPSNNVNKKQLDTTSTAQKTPSTTKALETNKRQPQSKQPSLPKDSTSNTVKNISSKDISSSAAAPSEITKKSLSDSDNPTDTNNRTPTTTTPKTRPSKIPSTSSQEEKLPSLSQPKSTSSPAMLDKPAVQSSVPTSFLKSMRIPKRKPSESELEEGETVSPSPSPLQTTTVIPTNTPGASVNNTSTAASKEKKQRTSTSNDAHDGRDEPIPERSTSSSRKQRLDEERPLKRDRYREEESSSSSRRDRSDRSDRHRSKGRSPSKSRHHRSRSRSRSRSPSRSHRSESQSRNRSSDSSSRKRQESSESSRRRSPTRSDRDGLKRKITESAASKYENLDSVGSTKDSKRQRTFEKDKASEKESKSTSVSSSKKPSPIPASTATTTTPSANIPATPEKKILSATAPNAQTSDQFRVFKMMFGQFGRAYKRRGDTQSDSIIKIIDHFHALCDFILCFYYTDKHDNINGKFTVKQSSKTWESIFSFAGALVQQTEKEKQKDLKGLCMRLLALIRYYLCSQIEATLQSIVIKHGTGTDEDLAADLTYIKQSKKLILEQREAAKLYWESEKKISYESFVKEYPHTFKTVCMEGNVSAGIVIGGEAGASVGPMFPLVPYSKLHHAAILSKCLLQEYVSKNSLNHSAIDIKDL